MGVTYSHLFLNQTDKLVPVLSLGIRRNSTYRAIASTGGALARSAAAAGVVGAYQAMLISIRLGYLGLLKTICRV